jgi:protein-disulfide isomerase
MLSCRNCWPDNRIDMRRPLTVAAAILAAAIAHPAALQQPAAAQLFVTSASLDATAETVTIAGGNFGGRPFVTLDLVPLDIRVAVDSLIVALAPIGSMPPGEYLLTVSRGSSPAEHASVEITLGGGQPKPEPPVRRPGPLDPASGKPGPLDSASGAPTSRPDDRPAARVGDRVISTADVDREWRRSDPAGYFRLTRELYEIRQRTLDTMVADDLIAREAAARGVSAEALLAEEVPKRRIPLPDSAVVSMFQSLGDTTRGASLDQMRPAIRAWLERHTEPELAKMTFVEELKKTSTRAETLLDAPRVDVERKPYDVALGPSSAPVELVVFADFQSPEYATLAQSFSRVRETFRDRLRLVFKNLPVRGAESANAAEASLCANAQGKFWPYHDALIAPGVLNAARLKSAAAAAGLDAAAFGTCVDRREFQSAVRSALEEADRYGLPGSPSVLVNGRLVPPPPPFLGAFDYLKRLIEEELGRVARGNR